MLCEGKEEIKRGLRYYSIYDYYQFVENASKFREQTKDALTKKTKL